MSKWMMSSVVGVFVLAMCCSGAALGAEPLPCVVDAPGFAADQARTAALVGCGALTDEGLSVSTTPVTQAVGDHVRLRMMRLESLVLVELVLVDDDGDAEIRRTTIQTLDELPVAAPRLARALVHGERFEDTVRHDNVVAGEARQLRTIDGEFFFGAGLQSVYVPGMSVVGAGAALAAMYEANDFAVTLDFRMRGMDQGGQDLLDWKFSLGGRYLLGEGNTAFLTGGGLSFGGLSVDTWDGDDWQHRVPDGEVIGEGLGLSAYGEVGVEMLRLYSTRLVVDLRVELPMFLLEGETWVPTGKTTDEWGYTYSDGYYEDRSYYVVPIGLGATWLF